MKKILSLITILSMMICSFPAAAHAETEEVYSEAVETLVALGIMEGSGGDLMLDKVLTRAEFVAMLMRIINSEFQSSDIYFEDVKKSHWAFTDISTACMMGIVQGNEEKKFLPDRPVVYEEMVKMLVCALGYGTVAGLKGGYPAGYMSIAQQKGLLDGATGRAGLIVKRRLAAEMIFNALDVPIMQEEGFGEFIEAVPDPNKTLLSENMKIRKGIGTVNANDVTSRAISGGVSVGFVQIDDELFRVGTANAQSYLGYCVTYYADISETEDNPPLLYARINEQRNEYITVAAEDIADSSTKNQLVYQEDGKTRNFNIDHPYADLIYNGVSTGGFTDADVKPASGTVTLIDNNSDNSADVVLVNEYETILVGSYNTTNYLAYDKDDVSKFVELDPESDDYSCAIYENGEECRFSLIRENSVLSVARSRNTSGRKNITVMLSNESASGMFEAVNKEENIAVIDGTQYDLVSGVYDELIDYLGQNITVYLDTFGKIAGIDDGAPDEFSYGYLIAAAVKSSISAKCQFKILTETGDVQIFEGAKKISLDENTAIGASDVVDKLPLTLRTTGASSGTGVEQMIRYRLNQNGEINAIDTTASGKVGVGDTLSNDIPYRGGEKETDGRRYISNLFGSENPEFAVTEKVVVFNIPKAEEKDDDTKYSVYGKDYFVSAEYYALQAYDIEDDMTVGACLIQDASAKSVDNLSRVVVVDKITVAIIDGIDTQKLTGYHMGQKVEYYAKDDTTFVRNGGTKQYQRGDIIRVAADAGSTVTAKEELLLDAADSGGTIGYRFDAAGGDNVGKFFTSLRIYYAYATNMKNGTLILQTDPDDDKTRYPYVLDKRTQYYLYDAETDEITLISAADMEEYLYARNSSARVAVASTGGTPLDVIVYDFSR